MTETPERRSYLDWGHADVKWTEEGHELTVEFRTQPPPIRHEKALVEAVERAITAHYRVNPGVFVAGNVLRVVDPQLLEIDADEIRNVIDVAVSGTVERTNALIERDNAAIQAWVGQVRRPR